MTPQCQTTDNGRMPLERALFALGGTMLIIAVLLTAFVSQWFLLLVLFVAANQWLYAVVGDCGASLMLKRLAGLKSVLYPTRNSA